MEYETIGELASRAYPEVSKVNLYFKEGLKSPLAQVASTSGYYLGWRYTINRSYDWSAPFALDHRSISRYVANRRSLHESGPYAMTFTSINRENHALQESIATTQYLRLRFFPYVNSFFDSENYWGFMVPDLLRREIKRSQVIDVILQCGALSEQMDVDSKKPQGNDSAYQSRRGH